MKQNDWLVAGITNPEFTTNDFLISGLNVNNTQLLTQEQYKKSPFIREAFTENGTFDEGAFNQFYKRKADEFGRLSAFSDNEIIYSPFDPRAKENSLIMSPKFELDIVANPNKEVTMLTGATYSNEYSDRERSQRNKIWDTAKGEWKDQSVNDMALFEHPIEYIKSLFSEPLVYATYDEDGEHYDPFSGQTIQHKKGERKLNEYGDTYVETLNGRSAIGKEVVSAFDYLTVDGEGINKYDFFDSDGLDKSVTGTVMKTAFSIAPLFLGPYVSSIYSGTLIARELAKSLPMLYSISTALFDTPESIPFLNELAAKAQSITTSTSDKGKQSMLNAETGLSMISDIALQFSQQKLISQSLGKLRGVKNLSKQAYTKAGLQYEMQSAALKSQYESGKITKEALEKFIGDPKKWNESVIGKAAIGKYMKEVEPIIQRTNKLGANTALAYMAVVSNTDVYDSMIEAGASRKEAAAVALGSTLGMYSVDKYLHLGELFFDDLTAQYEHQIRRTLKKEAASWYNVLKKEVSEAPNTTNKIKKLFQSGIELGKKATSEFADDLKYHSTGFFGKAIGEGLEEVGEEVVSDLSKGIYELTGELGLIDTSVKDVGAFDNALARYGMSFLGGSLGGGLFYGIDIYQNGKLNIDKTQDELIYLIRNNRTNEVLKTLDSFKKKGKLGNTSLSTKTEQDQNGNNVFISATDSEKSQNDFIYDRIKETVLQLETIINENGSLSEDQLFEKLILSESRFRDLEKYMDIQGFSYTTGYQRDYQNILSNIANLELGLKRANQTITGLNYAREEDFQNNIATDEALRNLSEDEKNARQRNIQKIKDELQKQKDELSKFVSGEYSIDYTEKMLFALDQHLNSNFIAMNYEQWLKKNHDGKTPEELSPSEQSQYKQEYLNYKRLAQEKELTRKFELYKHIKKELNPILSEIQQGSDSFKQFQEEIETLFGEDSPLYNLKQYKFDDVLDFEGETESSESYINRNESEKTQMIRLDKIEKYNTQQLEEMRQKINEIINKSGGFIDPITRRKLKLQLLQRNKDVSKNIMRKLSIDLMDDFGELSNLDQDIISLIESEIPNSTRFEEEDIDTVLTKVTNNVLDYHKQRLLESNEKIDKLSLYLNDVLGISEDGIIHGNEVHDFIEEQIRNGSYLDDIFDAESDLYYQAFEEFNLTQDEFQEFLSSIQDLYLNEELDSLEWETVDLSNESWKESQEVQDDLNKYHQFFDKLNKELISNPVINLNNDLDSKVSNINPVISLVKSLSLSLNKPEISNLEQLLEKLDSRFEALESTDDLILDQYEKESLEEASYILQLADTYLYAASNQPSPLFPYGHNRVLNEFAENHKDVIKNFEKLPELSPEVALTYAREIQNYLTQIGIYNEKTKQYNVGSYLWLSSKNEINKAGQFIRADRAWNETIYKLLTKKDEYGESVFKFEYEGKSYDLLEGCGTIPPIDKSTIDAPVYLNQAFDAFYKNIQQLRSEGWSYTEIWKRSKLLEKIAILSKVPDQKTCSLDENVSIDRLTDYDKVMFFATIGAMESTKFYSYLSSRIEQEDQIAPLTIQEWVSRIDISVMENPEIYNETLEYIKKETGVNLPIIYNSAYTGGNAGAGKSRVVAKNVALYSKTGEVWLSTPKESQINTLFESIGKGVKMLNRSSKESSEEYPILLEQIGINQEVYKKALELLSDYENTLDKINDPDNDTSFLTMTESHSSYIIEINPDKFGLKKVDNAPALIIIDEATHLSNLEIQLISHFAKLNGSKIIYLGDNKQKGFVGFGRNIERGQCLMVRTPNLGISLRDNNIQHQYNLNVLEDYMNQLSNLDSREPNYDEKVQLIISQIKNIKFRCYKSDDINGEVITNNMSEDLASKMSGSIGFVGNPSSHTLEVLKSAGLDPVVLPEVDIQGQEFDYVVIDKDFEIPKSNKAVYTLEFLQDLYTMISRGRNGSIIIDSSGELTKTIGENRVENTKTKATDISEYTKDFRDEKIAILNKILGKKSSTTPEPEPTPTPSSGPTSEPEKVKNINDVITNDTKFDFNSLDFENNNYAFFPVTLAVNEDFNGIDNSDHDLSNKGVLGTETILKQLIENGKDAKSKFNAIVIYKFPKDKFDGDIKTIKDLESKLEEFGENEFISNKYLDSAIIPIIETSGDDVKTDGSESQGEIEIDEDDLDGLGEDSSEISSNLEDISGDPMLCYGEATFTGMGVEIVDGKQVWINKNSFVGKVLGPSKVKSGAVPVISEYTTDNDGYVKIKLGSKGKSGISNNSQTTITREDIVNDADGQFLLEHTDDVEFVINDIVIRPDGTIYVTLKNVEFKGTNDSGEDISGIDDYSLLIKKLPFSLEKRDGQIFSSEERIESNQKQIDISRNLKMLKNSFLYSKKYEDLPDYITNIISKEQFESIEWYIESREKNDQDNFIRNIAFKEVTSFGSKDLIFTVVGKFKLQDGTSASITLGLLGSPNTWIDSIKKGIPQKRINNKINKLKQKLKKEGITSVQKEIIEKQIQYYENQLKSLDLNDSNSRPNRYTNFIEKISSEYNGSPVVIKVPTLITPGLTDLHKQKQAIQISRRSKELIKNAKERIANLQIALSKAKGNSITKANILSEIRKTEEFLAKFEKIKDYSFYSLNPYTVKSPIYIYTPSRAKKSSSDIDDSLVGKCCVMFVSNDMTLNPDDLVDIYIQQKNQTEIERKTKGVVDLKSSSAKPSVRMVVLNNMGVSFQDLSNPYLAESMKSTVTYTDKNGNKIDRVQIYPFKTNFMGVRMYVGMWNFRANLLQFKKYFDNFVKTLPISEEKLDDYLITKDLKWRLESGKNLTEEEKDFLDKHQGLEHFDEVSQMVDNFNNSLGDKVKQFRLGSDLTNGAYIRRLTGNIQSLYAIDDNKVNGIYLNSSTFKKYLDLSESIFTNILDHVVITNYEKDRLLSTKTGVKNSFANHISSLANSNGKIIVKDSYSNEECEINFGSSYDPSNSKGVLNTFSHIPAILSKVFKFTSIRQSHVTGNFDVEDQYSIKITGSVLEDGKDVKIDKKIPYYKIWEHVQMISQADEYDNSLLEGYVFDSTLSNFFSLAFHGTLENIQRRDIQVASDALFPHGFFADPLSTTESVYDGSNKMFTKAVQQTMFFGADVKVEDPTFYISLESVEQLMGEEKKPKVVVEDDEYTESCNKQLDYLLKVYSDLSEKINNVREEIKSLEGEQKRSYLESEIKNILQSEVESNFKDIFSGNNKDVNKNSLVYLQDWATALTLEKYLIRIYGDKYDKSLPPITEIRTDNKSLIIDAGDVTIRVTKGLNNTINIERLMDAPVSEESVSNFVESLINEIEDDVDEDSIDSIKEALEKFKAIIEPDDKIQQKEVIIKKLKKLSNQFVSDLEMFGKFKETINNIQDLNC